MRLNIKATWIQNASPQQDALTDLSYMSSLGQQSMNSSGLGSDIVDQVLSHKSCMNSCFVRRLQIQQWYS